MGFSAFWFSHLCHLNHEDSKDKSRLFLYAVAQCLTGDRRAASSSLTVVTALWSLRKTHLSQEDPGRPVPVKLIDC